MKKLTLFLVAITMSLFSFAAQPKRIYAYDLSSALVDKVYTFSFTANETPTSGKIIFYDATSSELVGEIALTNPVLGKNEVEIAEYSLPGNDGQQLNWSVELSAAEVTAFEAVYTGAKKYGRGHAAIDNSPESNYFGRVYVTDRRKTDSNGGLYVYTPSLQLVGNDVYKLGRSRNGYSRPAVAADGTLFLADYTDAERSGIYVVDPSDLTTCTQFYDGTRASNGLFTNTNGEEIGSSTSGVGVFGSGANMVLYTMMEDGSNPSAAVSYHIGQPDGSILKSWSNVPTWICKGFASINVSTNNAFAATEKGVWISQNDAVAVGSRTELVFIDKNGTLQFQQDKQMCKGAGLAVNADNSKLYISGSNNIVEYNITWNGNKPTLELSETHSISYAQVSTLSLDYAGNLIACVGASYGSTDSNVMLLVQYTLPTTNNTCEVPAKKADVVTKVEPTVALYTITTNVNDPTMGSVSGNLGTYEDGASAELTAVANDHYEFTGWTGDVSSTENPLTVTVNSDMTITANFQEHTKYTITAVPNDENMGTVTGGDTYYANESATLKATAKSGYVFAGWADGEENATRTVTVSGDATYTANFQAIAPRAWAYDLKVVEDGDNYKFTFNTTAAGTATLLFADIDGNPVAPTSHDVGPVAVGANTVLVAKAAFTENKDVYWSVKMDGEAIPAISEITDQSRGIYDFYNMMGVVVDNNTDSKDFGKIYVQMSLGGTTQGKAQTPGLFLFDQKLDGLNSNPNVGIQPSLPAGYTIGGDRNKFHRLNINPNTGDLVYSYNIASSPAVFAIDRENMAGNVTNLVEGVTGLTHTNAHCFDENGTLYVMDNASYPNTGAIYKIVDGVAKQFVANANWANASITMASDGRGGLWVSQNRGQMDTYYQLTHVTSGGTIDWYVNSSNPQGFDGSSARGALAYDVERQILAQGRNGKVELYTVSYEPTITLTPLHTIADANIGTNIDGLAFDYAGDLYVVNSSKEKFQKFTLPTDENICTVPAPSSQKLVLGTQCEVTVTVNDQAMGSVEGAGQYEKGAEVTLTPNPVAHHRFVNWTGDMTSTDNPLKFTIEGDVNLIATFEAIPQVTITVTSNDEDMGTVTGGGTYDEGQEVTIAATPKATYRFVKWSDDVTDATRTFPAAELTLQAIFEKVPNRAWAYDLSQVADGDNYKFSFVATTAGEATLLFADKDGNELVAPYAVGTVAAGSNTVTLAKTTFEGVTKDVYWSVKMDGEEITAVAEITDQAKGIYDFVDMTGVLVDNNPDSKYFGEVYVQMALDGTVGSKTQTAGLFIFDQTLAIKNTDANAGIQPILPSEYTMGDNRNKFHRLEIDPKTGNLTYCYNVADDPAIFVIDRENMAGNATNILEGVAGLTRTAAHCYDAEGTLYVMDIAASKGTIYKIVDGQAIQLTEPNAKWVNASISLAADGNGGLWVSHNRGQMDTYYQLVHVTKAGELDYTVWKDNTNGFEGGCNRGALAYDAERQILAQGRNGKVELYSVAFDATTGVPTLINIATTPLIANNIDGLAFDYAGDLYVVNTGTKKFYKYTIPTADNICIVPAPASQKLVLGTQCEVTVIVNDPAMGSVEGDGTYEKGTEVTLSANAVEHYRFVNWTGDKTSTDNPLKFTIEGDVNLTANFEAIPTYTINTSVNDSDMGTVTAGGTYYEDTKVTLTATANAGYVFVQWSDGVTEETRTFTATENVNLEAIFAKASPRAWAYDLRLDSVADPANYTFTFTATSAGNATIFFTDEEGTSVAPTQEVVGTVAAGETKTVTIAKSAFTGDKDIYWSVKVEGEAIAKMAELTDPNKGIYNFYVPQGVAVDNSPNSMYFGRIYVAEGTTGGNDGLTEMAKQMTAGLFVYNQALEKVQPATGYTGIIPQNVTFNTNKPTSTDEINITRQQMHRVAVDPVTGEVAFAYYKDPATAIYSMNPDDLAGNAQNLIKGSSITYANSLCFDSEGTLYVMDNANTGLTGGQIYKIQDDEVTLFAAHDKNNQWAVYDNAMASDGRGGLWIAQNRYGYDYPILSHVNKNGEVDFAVKENLNGWFPNNNTGSSYRGQLAYNLNENILAFAGNKMVTLFIVAYDGNGKPTINKLMSTPLLGGGNIDGVAFDYAGDLYVASASAERLYKFVVPTTDNICTVPAPESQIIMKEARYTVTVVADPAEMGTVTEGGEYKAGEKVTLTATANTGYRFVNWTKDAEEVSISASFEYTVPAEDVTLTANFAPLPAITYELNDGVWNKYGWTSKKDMYNALLDDWRAYSGSARTNVTYETQLGIGNSSKGIPTTITSVDDRVAFWNLFADATYALKWGWLATYVDAVASTQYKKMDVAQGVKTQPTSAAGVFTFTIGNFFGEDNAHSTDYIDAVDFTGVEAHLTAFAPYWGQTFPMPTQPTEEIVLNAPYKEGYLFEGWYAAPDFSGAEVITVDENTNGTLYAKWLEHRYTRIVTNGYFGTICLPYGSNNYSGAEFYEISYLQLKDDGVTPMGIWLDEVTELVAGKPYIFKATSNQLVVNYEGDEVLSPIEGKAGLTGTFDGITDETVLQGNYMIADNRFWLCGAGCWLDANRAYIDKNTLHNNTTPVAAIPGRRRVMMGAAGENTTTGVDNLTEDGVVSTNQATKMVVNGQLIIIRDGVKYNVQGVRL
ncbi:MAG: InlB B-repeat-containing protein [Paludibacteraceae bacterium]|nr:InlB B-repeat-containing protein [Paludibacteraceae bacterium]